MVENVEIEEYHLCAECKSHMSVPASHDMTKWELACKRKRSEVNSSGGLTRCPVWEEE